MNKNYKTRLASTFAVVVVFFVTVLLFQNCSNSSSSDSSPNSVASITQEDFNNKLVLLMVNANVPVSSYSGAYANIKVPTIACGLDKGTSKDSCYFIFTASEVYKSALSEAGAIKNYLETQSAPRHVIENESTFSYIRNVNCIGNMIKLEGSSCSYEKTTCDRIEDCVAGFNNNGIPEPIPPVIVDPVEVPTNPGNPNGAGSLDFTPVSQLAMSDFVNETLTNPSNFKIKVSLKKVGNGRYGGSVNLSFTENGLLRSTNLESGVGVNQSFNGMYDNGRLQSDFNYWYTKDNKTIFSGFFEDRYGAIVLVILKDVNNPANNKGYVHYKKFTVTSAPHSPYRSCWFTYMGPYDCRSTEIINKSELFPTAAQGYSLLGTFDNIIISESFLDN